MARNEGTREAVFIAVNNYRDANRTAVDAKRPSVCASIAP